MWQKAQTAYTQGRLFDPVNDCALHWAILSRRAGNPGGKALEHQIDQVYEERVAQNIKQRNYAGALALINGMMNFYPGNKSLLADQQKVQAAANSANK